MQYLKALTSLISKIKREASRSGDNRAYAQAVKTEKEIKKLKNIISSKST
jgi:hypothetical protein